MPKSSLILGGSGALGSKMVTQFARQGWKALSIDVRENKEASANIVIDPSQKMQDQLSSIHQQVAAFSKSFDSMVCMAGGFSLSSVKDKDILEQFEKTDQMNFQTALLHAHLASHYLGEQSLAVFTGAAAVFSSPANFAFAYAMSKSSTHALVMNLSAREDIPPSSRVVCILPTMIDTPANREAMPDADFNEWLPPEKIAELVGGWSDGLNTPENGSFAKLDYKNGSVVPTFV